jgi:hypothetical protein
MVRNFIIGASLVALGLIVAGSLDSVRIASPRFATSDGASPIYTRYTTRQIGWQRDLALPQAGAAALQLTRVPKITSGK